MPVFAIFIAPIVVQPASAGNLACISIGGVVSGTGSVTVTWRSGWVTVTVTFTSFGEPSAGEAPVNLMVVSLGPSGK